MREIETGTEYNLLFEERRDTVSPEDMRDLITALGFDADKFFHRMNGTSEFYRDYEEVE